MVGAQHSAAFLPLAAKGPFGFCQQQPNPQVRTMRALLEDLAEWVRDGVEPPLQLFPVLRTALVAADQWRFPPIRANSYGGVDRPAIPL